MRVKILTTAVLAAFSFATEAAEFQIGNEKISIDVPSGWTAAKDLFGMPLILLGPPTSTKNGAPGEVSRAVLTFTSTTLSEFDFDLNRLEQTQNDYVIGRKRWLDRQDGRALRFIPMRRFSWEIGEAFMVGFRYLLHGEEFSENSYYVMCGGLGYHLKTLLPNAGGRSFVRQAARELRESVRSFRCQN